MSTNSEQIAYWNDEAGRRWASSFDRIEATFAPLTIAVLDAARPQPGEAVVDVGCGCGATALELAGRVAPGGRVVGVDISEPMLAVARERTQLGTNAKFVLADASTHDFGASVFDLMFSRFGVMFFDRPARAFANLRRSLRLGGRLTFVCWRPLADNPWFSVPLEAARTVVSAPPASDPDAPGPLAFADPDRVRRILAEAGFAHVQIDALDAMLPLGEPASAAAVLTRLGPAARLLVDAAQPVRDSAENAIERALRPHETPSGLQLGAGVWIVRAAFG
jgi:SAM-dependent methyltransferase